MLICIWKKLSIHFSPLISYLSVAADLSASPLRPIPHSVSVDAGTEISCSSASDVFKTCRTETANVASSERAGHHSTHQLCYSRHTCVKLLEDNCNSTLGRTYTGNWSGSSIYPVTNSTQTVPFTNNFSTSHISNTFFPSVSSMTTADIRGISCGSVELRLSNTEQMKKNKKRCSDNAKRAN